MRQHVAPVVPIVPAPFAIVEPLFDALQIQNFGQSIGFMTRVVPFASAQNGAHVLVFPTAGHIREVFVRVVEVNIRIVIALEKRTDVERAADCRAMRTTIMASEVEYLANNDVFVSVMCSHPVGWVN